MTQEEIRRRDIILAEDYREIIARQSQDQELIQRGRDHGAIQEVSTEYHIVYVPSEEMDPIRLNQYHYSSIPYCYTLTDRSALSVSGIGSVQNHPALDVRGRNVLIGFVDTGIDYQSDVFKDSGGRTRILSIWDQTQQNGETPQDFSYGTEYTREMIDEAINSPDPISLLPHTDRQGHGTFLAGAAAGSYLPEQDVSGAAPEAVIAMVKLKEAKQNLKNFYQISEKAAAYAESDIMLGISYLHKLAMRFDMPLVLCIALGSNSGDHTGYNPLAAYLNTMAMGGRRAVVTAAGNEALQAHHYSGMIGEEEDQVSIELEVFADNDGFTLEFWGAPLDVYTIAFQTPLGEVIPAIPPRDGSSLYSFVLENTKIYVDYKRHEGRDGSQLILVRFQQPTQGIWKIGIGVSQILHGSFDLWLPATEFLSSPVYFLAPDPDKTIQEPAVIGDGITVGAYNHINNSIYADSGRGYTRDDRRKPDLAAPGVNVSGIYQNERKGYMTGSSVAAAITAGACALFMEWGAVQRGDLRMNSVQIRNNLIRGASVNPNFLYYDRQWGYGPLDLMRSFERMT